MNKLLGRLKTFPIHPLLFALYPVIFLYAYNFSQVSFFELIVPLVFSLIATILFYGVCALIYRNKEKAAILVSVGIVFFFFYGNFYDGSKLLVRSVSGSSELSTAII